MEVIYQRRVSHATSQQPRLENTKAITIPTKSTAASTNVEMAREPAHSDESDEPGEGDSNSESDGDANAEEDADEHLDPPVGEKGSYPTKDWISRHAIPGLEPPTEMTPANETTPRDQSMVPPGQGSKRTQQRNARRKLTKRLVALIKEGKLQAGATIDMLFKYDRERQSQEASNATREDEDHEMSGVQTEQIMPNGHGPPKSTTRSHSRDSVSEHEQDAAVAVKVSDKTGPREELSEDESDSSGDDSSADDSSSEESSEDDSSEEESSDSDSSSDADDRPEEITSKKAPTANVTSTFQADGGDTAVPCSSDTVGPGITQSPVLTGLSVKQGRKKLDLSASQRLVFGSLGVRAPKTEAERASLQQKLSDKVRRQPLQNNLGPVEEQQTNKAADTPAANERAQDLDPEDPQYWTSMINLTAVECIDGPIKLSTPPFPFYQRWDTSQQRGTGSKKRKRKHDEATHPAGKSRKADDYTEFEDGEDEYGEEYDYEYDEEYEGDGGDYDYFGDGEEQYDYVDEVPDTEVPDDEAIIDTNGTSQHHTFQSAATVARRQQVDALFANVPPLPTNMSTLEPMSAQKINQYDVIVFTRLEVSAATGWQPTLSPYRTAVVEDIERPSDNDPKGETILHLILAPGDQPPVEFDENGDRIWGKFEVDTGEDDDDFESEGRFVASFDELIDVRKLGSVVPF